MCIYIYILVSANVYIYNIININKYIYIDVPSSLAGNQKKNGTSQYFNTLRRNVFSVLNLPSRSVPEGGAACEGSRTIQYCVNPSSSVLSHVEFVCLVLPLSFKLWKILKANHYHTTCLNGNKWTLLPFANFSTINQQLQCIVVFHFVSFDHWSHHRRYLAYLGMFPQLLQPYHLGNKLCLVFGTSMSLSFSLTGAHSIKAVATLHYGQPFRLRCLDETRLEVPMSRSSHFCALFNRHLW